MKKVRMRKKEIKSPSYKKEWFAVSTLFFGYEFLLCDYANIIINKMIASQIRKHQELSHPDNKATINGIQISTNNKAHTIARNILFKEKN